MSTAIDQRHQQGVAIVTRAAATALARFRDIDSLAIEQKGHQDFVSAADREVETQIRTALAAAFPADDIIGEEHEDQRSDAEFTWVIDPIDGTSNFVLGMPGWCVVLACVRGGETVLAVICDPIAGETFVAIRGQGASLNGRPLAVSTSTTLGHGRTGIGFSSRAEVAPTAAVIKAVMQAGGLQFCNSSGALMIAYVAAGRLIGYCEAHMNAWDCLAALLLVEEAGGQVEPFEMQDMLAVGGKVVAACPGVYPALVTLCAEL